MCPQPYHFSLLLFNILGITFFFLTGELQYCNFNLCIIYRLFKTIPVYIYNTVYLDRLIKCQKRYTWSKCLSEELHFLVLRIGFIIQPHNTAAKIWRSSQKTHSHNLTYLLHELCSISFSVESLPVLVCFHALYECMYFNINDTCAETAFESICQVKTYPDDQSAWEARILQGQKKVDIPVIIRNSFPILTWQQKHGAKKYVSVIGDEITWQACTEIWPTFVWTMRDCQPGVITQHTTGGW